MKKFYLCLVTLSVGIIYFPGLSGAFYFDDFGQIVLNSGLLIDSLDLENILRAAHASNAGPLGRPISAITFGVEHFIFGLDPFYYKLNNLFIHLINLNLCIILGKSLLDISSQKSNTSKSHTGTILAAGTWWGVHPLCVTSVLYVVQRMTSLSALFTLVGLILYCKYRIGTRVRNAAAIKALTILVTFTIIASLCKEIGLLTPIYAALIEALFFQFKTTHAYDKNLLRCFFAGGAFLVLSIASFYLLIHPEWFNAAFSGRPFTAYQRLLTQTRILWFYLELLFVPRASYMGIYHDDIIISSGLMEPITTIYAIFGHVIFLVIAIFFWRRNPIISFSILWFYIGHLLESTIFPLELTFEHRNYLPIFGPILGACHVLIGKKDPSTSLKLRSALLATMLFAAALTTSVRARDMGNWKTYPILDAYRHPHSARANFDAGQTFLRLMIAQPALIPDYVDDARYFFESAIQSDPNALPPFNGLFHIAQITNEPISIYHLEEFKYRLKNGIIPASIHHIFRSFLDIAVAKPSALTFIDANSIFEAALLNPKLVSSGRAGVRTAYSLFLGNAHKHAESLTQMREAIKDAPGAVEFRILFAAMLIEQHQYDSASAEIEIASRIDQWGYYKEDIIFLQNALLKRNE